MGRCYRLAGAFVVSGVCVVRGRRAPPIHCKGHPLSMVTGKFREPVRNPRLSASSEQGLVGQPAS